ncbi:hypothetical protein SK224_05415 [Microbacterium sp. BG28]|uniref:hypothetical protein n=1 Tax=Microbacterium sp. BG28 TaxID=3097356 RepID=UPI002A59CA33|nr:hypothetical protein [Microbacterium sp. BG28]MDY0828563.1 hypothetical protein [Microbacterium sp. BG28]
MTSSVFALAAARYHELRSDYELVLEAAYASAEAATNGHMLNRRAREAGISSWDLFTHNGTFARAYASEELLEHWASNPRPTFSSYEAQMQEPGWL